MSDASSKACENPISSAAAEALSASSLEVDLATAGESCPVPRRNFARLGLGLMLFSGVLWAPLPVLPFLSLPASVKVVVGTVLFIAVQFAWWGGTVLAGPAVVRKVYALFRKLQWWKKAQPVDTAVLPPVP
jgi:hypothetical protein